MTSEQTVAKSVANLRLFYDGACPLCTREIAGLTRLDRGRGRLEFVDIAAPEFNAAAFGADPVQLMAKIHGQLADGTWVEGMEVFRHAYRAVGLGWLLAPTGWPGLRRVFDAAYRWFARNRLRLTGRSACGSGACGMPLQPNP